MTRDRAEQMALEYYKKRRLEIDRELDAREAEASAKSPALAALLNERSELPMRAIRLSLGNPQSAKQIAQDMERRGIELSDSIKKALADAGFAENYLSRRYTCEKCRDTGFLDGAVPQKTCECFEKRVSALMLSDKNPSLSAFTFDDFNDSVIPQTGLSNSSTQRAWTHKVKEMCEDFARDKFTHKGILLSGNAGLGKTFLLSCVYNRVLELGYGAVALTSFELTQKIRAKQFGLDDEGMSFDDIIKTPVLLIDDLGNEPAIKGISAEYICVMLNERMNNDLRTLITTNLTPKQFAEMYNERVMSRLADKRYWGHIQLLGEDIRRA